MSRTSLVPHALSLTALCLGCGDATPTTAPLPAGCTVALAPGGADLQQRVQTALIEARAGATVCFTPGTYLFTAELSVTTPNITVKGTAPGVVFDFRNQQRPLGDGGMTGNAANGMLVTGAGFTIDTVTLKNSPGDGIRVQNTSNATFRRLNVSWDAGSVTANGAYAIYPVNITGVLVENCEVVGASDAGIYVGQSRDIIVRNNVVHGNVAGIEVENSTNADVYDNRAYDNTAGILVFNLPNLPVRDGRRCLVRSNTIENNNRANFAPRGSIVGQVPAGTGMLVMSADETEVRGNTVRGNVTTGVVVLNYRSILGDPRDAMYSPYPETTWIHDNTFAMNGADPQYDLLRNATDMLPLEDILWDGSVDPMRATDPTARLCITGNTGARYRNLNLADVGAGARTDLAPHNCMHPALPMITQVAGR